MSTYYVAGIPCSDELYHHGIKGQKWGIRRYQNTDGTLTNEGRIRYSKYDAERDLGMSDKKKLTSVDKKIRDYYQSYKLGEDRLYQKAAKKNYKGKDPTKYINRAKQFAKSAEMYKVMSQKYQALSEREQKSMARIINAMEIGGYGIAGIAGAAVGTLTAENYLKTRLY